MEERAAGSFPRQSGAVLPGRDILAKQQRIERAETNGPGAKKCMAVSRIVTGMGSKIGRTAMAAGLSAALGLGVVACSRDYTSGYVYMTTTKADPGLINGYKIDYQSGHLDALEDSPIATGGRNPVALVAAPNGTNLYVLNHDDSTVVWIAIGTDGKLYPQTTYNTTGSFPTAAAIDPAGKFLFVTFTYQLGFTTALPGPGGVTVYPIKSDNSLGTPLTVNVGRNPVGIATSDQFVYVVEQDSATLLNLLGFSLNSTTGAMTPLPGVTINPNNAASTGFLTGTTPAAILGDSGLKHLYVTEQSGNRVIGYSIATNGVPSQIGSAGTGAGPVGLTIDASGKFMYVANSTDGTIGGFTFGSNGQPVVSTVARSVQSGTGTNCVTTIGAPNLNTGPPTHAVYLYASNGLSGSVTGEQMDQNDGSLKQIQGTPFGGSALPSCVTSVPSFAR
jgi:6-phosphogluconolactonase